MAEEFGIEKLKEVGLVLCKFGMELENALEDGKLSLWEGIDVIIGVGPQAMALVDDFGQIKDEFADLSVEETDELVEYITSELDLQSASVEDVIESALEWLAATYDLFDAIREARA